MRKFPNPIDSLYLSGNVHDKLLRKNLNIVIWAAAVGTVCFSTTGGAPMTGYATTFKASDFEFGILWAMPVLASLLQFSASALLQRTGQTKKIFLIAGVIQRMVWFIAAFIPYFIPESLAHTRIWWLLTVATMASVAGAYVNITFYAFFIELVPMNIRGQYISFRTLACTLFSIAGGFLAAFILDNMPGYTGFTIVFSIAAICGTTDILMFIPAKMPKLNANESRTSIIKGLKETFSKKRSRDYMIFWCTYSFSLNIAFAFFNKYVIEIQGLSYTQIILFGQIPANILSIIMLPRWGRFLDKYGSRFLLNIAVFLSAAVVLVWLPAVPGTVLNIFLFNFFNGMVLCGIDITSQSMLITHTADGNRSMSTAIYFVCTSICSALAFTLGGAFLELTKEFFNSRELRLFNASFDHYKLLFLISSLLRFGVALIFAPRIWNEKDSSWNTIKSDISYIINRIITKIKIKHINK